SELSEWKGAISAQGKTVDDCEAAAIGMHLEDRPAVSVAPNGGRRIQVAVAGLGEPSFRLSAVRAASEAVKDDEVAAVGKHLKDRASATRTAGDGRPIQGAAVACLDERVGVSAIRAADEAMKNRVAVAVHIQLKSRAEAKRPAQEGCAIKIAVVGLDEPRLGLGAVGADEAKAVEHKEGASVGEHSEGCAPAKCAARGGYAIEIAITGLDQPKRTRTLIAGEAVKDGKATSIGRQLENSAAITNARAGVRPIERSIAPFD